MLAPLVGLLVAFTPLASAAELTAGDVDDNLNFAFYNGWAGRTRGNDTSLPNLDLSDRVTVRVVNGDGLPISNAVVEVRAGDAADPFLTTHAGSDGVFRFFPRFDGAGEATDFSLKALPADGSGDGATLTFSLATLPETRELTVVLEGASATTPGALDLMFVIDTTGSMADELAYITEALSGIVSAIQEDHPATDIRYGLILYRDDGDDYVVRSFDFTDSLDTMKTNIAAQHADGGGDTPEAMHEALSTAAAAAWRDGNTARVMVLVADAPPHVEHYGETIAAIGAARGEGIHIYSLAASGADLPAEFVMREASVLTQGRYMFLTDDSGVGSSHADPHIECYQVTSLSSLIARVISSELAGMRVEAAPEHVIRTVGTINAGLCTSAGDGGDPITPVMPGSVSADGSYGDLSGSTKWTTASPTPVFGMPPGSPSTHTDALSTAAAGGSAFGAPSEAYGAYGGTTGLISILLILVALGAVAVVLVANRPRLNQGKPPMGGA